MFNSLMDSVFSGCTDTVDKIFCMCMFLFVVEMFVGIMHALITVGGRKR